MRTYFERPARIPLWIAGISTCLLVAAGLAAIARAIPSSYASIPDGGAPSKYGAPPGGSEDAQTQLAAEQATTNRRKRAPCPGCGVIASMRQIERSGGVGGKRTGDAKVAGRVSGAASDATSSGASGVASGGVSGSASAADAVSAKSYEITVRFPDGSTTVFDEATPRAWRPGSRVIVIGGLYASNN